MPAYTWGPKYHVTDRTLRAGVLLWWTNHSLHSTILHASLVHSLSIASTLPSKIVDWLPVQEELIPLLQSSTSTKEKKKEQKKEETMAIMFTLTHFLHLLGTWRRRVQLTQNLFGFSHTYSTSFCSASYMRNKKMLSLSNWWTDLKLNLLYLNMSEC